MESIIVFGTGDNFIHNYTFIKENYHIVGFIDNAKSKLGTMIDDIPISGIELTDRIPFDRIIITPNAYPAIIKQLIQYGVESSKIKLLSEVATSDNTGKLLKIAFYIHGGVGDYLIAANYIYIFWKHFCTPNMTISIYCGTGQGSVKAIFHEHECISEIYNYDREETFVREYDLYIRLTRYPEVVKKNTDKIIKFNPLLIDYLLGCEKFKIFNQRFFVSGFIADGQSAVLCGYEGIKRIQQPDIYNMLDISEEYQYPLFIDEDEERYLSEIGLRNKKFITIHRGCDSRYSSNSVKLWPIQYYNELIENIKSKYPDLIIVQVGVSHERCLDMEKTDINLLEQTSLEQVKILLKNSLIHIDNEGGMVHLRHALKGGTSIVLFGPTSKEFYGYSENVNLIGNGCTHWCEWVTDSWQEKCARGYKNAPCMSSITPSKVLNAFNNIMIKEN